MYPMNEKEWQAKEDMRILQMAREIEQNSSRLAAAKEQANREIEQLKTITGSGGVTMKQTASGFNVPQFGGDK